MPRLAFTPVGPKIEVLLALACRSPGRTDSPRSWPHEKRTDSSSPISCDQLGELLESDQKN